MGEILLTPVYPEVFSICLFKSRDPSLYHCDLLKSNCISSQVEKELLVGFEPVVTLFPESFDPYEVRYECFEEQEMLE